MIVGVRNISRAIAFALFICLAYVPLLARATTSLLDTSFADPTIVATTGVVALARQSDGKLLVGGQFTSAGGQARAGLARYNGDGTLDMGFVPPSFPGIIAAIAVQSDSKILAAGTFTAVDGTGPAYLVRLNSDGTLDTDFNPDVDDQVWTLALQTDGKIVIAGMFSKVGGVDHVRLARLDSTGAVDATFNPNVNSAVNAVAIQNDGKILIGGQFSTVNNAAHNRLARLDSTGTVDETFNPNVNGTMRSIAVQSDGKILIGGLFTLVNGTARSRMARLNSDGTLDAAFDPNFNQTVHRVEVQSDGKILVGGEFTSVGGAARSYLVRLDTNGVPDGGFIPVLNGIVYTTMLLSDGKVMAGGGFASAGGSGYAYLARFYGGIYTVSVTAPANGSVSSSPAGIVCGATCSAEIIGSQVTLTATPASGYSFAGWGGDCAGSANPLALAPIADIVCTATFDAAGPAPVPPPAPPAPPPAFVTTAVPPVQEASTVGAGAGSFSFASSFSDPSSLTFTAAQSGGAPLPSWLTFTPATVSFTYDVPIPPELPIQPVTGADRTIGRAEAPVARPNTIYPPSVRVAQLPITLTATGGGQSYVSTFLANFYAPRPPVAISAVSLSLDGVVGNGRSGRSALSWDGGQMVFETAATNLFPASPNSRSDILRYQALSGGRDRLSQTAIPGGGVANTADGASSSPAVSADGRYAAFASEAPGITLIPSRGVRQVYRTALGYPRIPLNEQATPAPDFVSITADGIAGNGPSDNPEMSQDGRHVVFESTATNFGSGLDGAVRVWRKDMQTGALVVVSNGPGGNATVSWDGRFVAFERDGAIHLRDMASDTITQVASGTRPRLTARADRIAFVAPVNGVAQIMVADLGDGRVRAVTAGNGPSDQPAISADGRFVAFRSGATNLVSGYEGNSLAQIFVHDVERGVTALVSQTASGAPGTGASWNPALSGDGGTLSFGSDARDIVNGNPAAGQAYLAANPLPLPGKTGYWYMAGLGGGQGWAMERWGNRLYVGGLAYDDQGRSQWLAGPCTLSGLVCEGVLTGGPTFSLVTAENGASASLVVGGAPARTLTMFPIGGIRTTGYAGLPQAGWWYEPDAGNGVGYFLSIDSQPQADGSIAQVGYLAVLGYDASGAQVWQSAQATLAADQSFSGTLMQYAGGLPFGAETAGASPSATAVGPVRMTFAGTDRARVTLPDGRSADLARFRF